MYHCSSFVLILLHLNDFLSLKLEIHFVLCIKLSKSTKSKIIFILGTYLFCNRYASSRSYFANKRAYLTIFWKLHADYKVSILTHLSNSRILFSTCNIGSCVSCVLCRNLFTKTYQLFWVASISSFIWRNIRGLPSELGLPKYRLIFNIGIGINFGIHFQFRN